MTTDLDDVRAARAALTLLTPVRNRALHDLLLSSGPLDTFAWLTASDTPDDDRAELLRGISVAALRDRAAAMAELTAKAEARLLIPEDPGWPARLDDTTRVEFTAVPSSAICLWVRGTAQPAAALTRMVAVVGSRAATQYGVTVAGSLGHDLTAGGWTVVAGSGYGIDAAALRGALSAGGPAVAVMPAGIDRPYPAGNTDLLEQVTDRGLLISATAPGTLVSSTALTAARRLLAGMTSGAVVVEAASSSGTLLVLQEATNRGRPAMVVPGPVTSLMSAGALKFLREHRPARLVRGAADIIAELPTTR